MMHSPRNNCTENLCSESGGWISPERGRKDKIVRVERAPFAGGGEVVSRATDEFVSAIQFTDKAGVAEGGNEFVFFPLEPSDAIQFHTPTLAGGVGHLRSEGKISVGARKPDGGAWLPDIDAFKLEHGLCDKPDLGVRHFRREDLREATFHFIQAGRIGFPKTKELAIVTADDGHEFLFLAAGRFAHEHDDFLPVKCLGRRFGHVHFLAGLGGLHPGFERHDDGRSRVRDAHEAGIGGEVVLGAGIGNGLRHEHQRAVRAD